VLRVGKHPGEFDTTLFGRLLACFRCEHVKVVHTQNPLPLGSGPSCQRAVGTFLPPKALADVVLVHEGRAGSDSWIRCVAKKPRNQEVP
jgi:hypothetical protein